MAFSRGKCRLKELRKKAGIRPRDIVTKTGYSRQMVWAFENDQKKMSPEAMYAISRVIGCCMEDLYPWFEKES